MECDYLRYATQLCCQEAQYICEFISMANWQAFFQCSQRTTEDTDLPHWKSFLGAPVCAAFRPMHPPAPNPSRMPAPRSKNAALSETLKLVRHRRGLKASEVALRMGLPLRTYHHFEGGRAHIDIDRIRSFAEATDSDPHAILTAVLIGSPAFAARTMDNKMVSVLISGAQRFDERLGDRLSRIEVARFIAATRRMFDDLEADLAERDEEARRWLINRDAPRE